MLCRIPNVFLRGFVCRTNVASNTAFRGFGGPQGLLICESWIDQIATTLDVPADQVGIFDSQPGVWLLCDVQKCTT